MGVLVGTVVVLVLAFVLLSPGDDDESDTATTPTVAGTPATTPESPADEPQQTTTAVTPPAAGTAQERFTIIRLQTGAAVDGVKTIRVKKGERVRIRVSSQDTTDEVHIHGYDLSQQLKAKDSVRFSFDADAEGIFEIELEDSRTQIGKLVVEP